MKAPHPGPPPELSRPAAEDLFPKTAFYETFFPFFPDFRPGKKPIHSGEVVNLEAVR
ncbi:hypothetical protein RSSM_04925 [Rhodopirellula sallentina SM41]|uniref:Uncharacterized protein n=1 Tax=Rhodopirellula sallentina SM41 TaxID=1263870 RepID=M5TWN3_9BACT|nr:hypothetical protein RSSM_04925 [Rhodopirellula sallentina SM41]